MAGELAALFQELNSRLHILAVPHPGQPGRHTIAIGCVTTYTEEATDEMSRALAVWLREALAAEGVTAWGHPLHIPVQREP